MTLIIEIFYRNKQSHLVRRRSLCSLRLHTCQRETRFTRDVLLLNSDSRDDWHIVCDEETGNRSANSYECNAFKTCWQMNDGSSDTSTPSLKTYLRVYRFAMYTRHFTSSGYSRHQDEILKGFNRYIQWLILFHFTTCVGGHIADELLQSGTTKSSIVMPVNERRKKLTDHIIIVDVVVVVIDTSFSSSQDRHHLKEH